MAVAKCLKRKEEGESNSAHRRSRAKCQLVQTSYVKRIKLLLFAI